MKKSQKAAESKMGRKDYEKALQKLQVELCRLQDWVKETGARVILVLEGRDGAGKGGTIKAITERVSPRVFRVVALPAPSDREKTQIQFQRYFTHFPAAGEIVIFDRKAPPRTIERVVRPRAGAWIETRRLPTRATSSRRSSPRGGVD